MQWELISGGDLLELLNECNGCMTETAAAFYYAQLLRGVLHMHAVGYCHRFVRGADTLLACVYNQQHTGKVTFEDRHLALVFKT